MKNAFILIGMILMFLAGIWITKWYFSRSETVSQSDVSVLIERIESVTKLVTVEGYFSEIYDYQDYYGYDLGVFRKKALIRVKAKVSVGYDLEKMKITALTDSKTIRISSIPLPELMSIDHDLDYYDVQEGIFNQFSKEDYNKLNANAKQFIRQKAQESDLFEHALLERNKLFEMIRLMVESSGWKLELEGTGETFQGESIQQ